MMKSICVLARRADLSRRQFHDYYENNHAPLGAKHFPFRRYVRNHLVDHADIGFDTISEFWAEDIAAMAGLMDGSIGDIMRADERRFMDQSRIAPGGAEEHRLSKGAPAQADGRRLALLADWDDSAETVAGPALLEWARTIAAQFSGVSLDLVQSWGRPAFPAKAVLWIPSADDLFQPPRLITTRAVTVTRVETPPGTLLAS